MVSHGPNLHKIQSSTLLMTLMFFQVHRSLHAGHSQSQSIVVDSEDISQHQEHEDALLGETACHIYAMDGVDADTWIIDDNAPVFEAGGQYDRMGIASASS